MAQNKDIGHELEAYEAKLGEAHGLMQDLTHAQIESVNYTALGLGHIKSAIEAFQKAQGYDGDALRFSRGIMAALMQADVIARPLGLETSSNEDAAAILQGPEAIGGDVQAVARYSSAHSVLITANALLRLETNYDMLTASNAEVSFAASRGTDVLSTIERFRAASEAYRGSL